VTHTRPASDRPQRECPVLLFGNQGQSRVDKGTAKIAVMIVGRLADFGWFGLHKDIFANGVDAVHISRYIDNVNIHFAPKNAWSTEKEIYATFTA